MSAQLRSQHPRIAPLQTQKVRKTPDQIFKAYSFALNSEAASAAAVAAASEPFGGRCPDAVFMCAGASRPGFFVEQDEASLRQGMEITYYAQAFTALVSFRPLFHSTGGRKI